MWVDGWLKSRRRLNDFAGSRFPVFVVIAKGRGLDAAAATALAISSLYEQSDCFLEHVVAISASSGAAIGSTIALGVIDDHVHSRGNIGCDPNRQVVTQEAVRIPSQEVVHILSHDHLASIIGAVLPDTFLLALPFPVRGIPNRADAFVRSLLRQYRHTPLDRGLLNAPYAYYSYSAPRSPALLIGATESSTGRLVAFSPFDLLRATDGQLASMQEFSEGMEMVVKSVSLLDASVVSARTPYLFPEWVVATHERRCRFTESSAGRDGDLIAARALVRALERLRDRRRDQFNIDVDVNVISIELVAEEEIVPSTARPRMSEFATSIAQAMPGANVFMLRFPDPVIGAGCSGLVGPRLCLEHMRRTFGAAKDCSSGTIRDAVDLKQRLGGVPENNSCVQRVILEKLNAGRGR